MCPLRWIEAENVLISSDGARRYPVVDGIPCLFAPNEWPQERSDVTDIVKAFYEQTPFPNYDDVDNRERLSAKARHGVFARLLDEQLPRPAKILEVGCGTGQLSNFLGMSWGRTVIGADLCLNSLRLAKSFRDRCSIANAQFVQMNLFRLPFPDETFDIVICNGVLHHTSDAEGGFRALARKLRPGGYVIIGLYNWLGRLPTLGRRWLIERLGERWVALDPRLRTGRLNTGRRAAWFMDQYRHPHETRHSMAELGSWFRRSDVGVLFTIPPVGGERFIEQTQLFRERPTPRRLDYITSELEMLLEGGKDGGLYMMIGRKGQPPSARAARSQESNRSFGWVFTAVFVIVGLWPAFFGLPLRWWSLVTAVFIALVTAIAPAVLTVPNRLWLHFGLILNRLVSPVVIAVLFYAVVTPIGWLMRVSGKDGLRLRGNGQSKSFWIERKPPGPKADSLRKQF
jgi:SAM-dependent methyltransferase